MLLVGTAEGNLAHGNVQFIPKSSLLEQTTEENHENKQLR